MSSAAQYKKEKKVIEEKLQKVRQVVQNVSNNDIILALHTYDLNVERTIQAFLEGQFFLLMTHTDGVAKTILEAGTFCLL